MEDVWEEDVALNKRDSTCDTADIDAKLCSVCRAPGCRDTVKPKGQIGWTI